MGSELCTGPPIQQTKASLEIDYEKEVTTNDLNKVIRKAIPTTEIAFNMNNLPDAQKQPEQLAELQEKIIKVMAHEKRNQKSITINKKANEKNYLPDPYYIRSIKSIYIGQWVHDKEIRQQVPGGIGRLYTQDNILEGEFISIRKRTIEQVEDPNKAVFLQNRQLANFFGVDPNEQNLASFKQIDQRFSCNSFIDIEVVLNGQGRIFTRTKQLRGSFKEGELHGNGYCKIKEGEDIYQYTGQFKRGRKNGKGLEKFKLTTYDGDFIDDKKTGKGIFTLISSLKQEKERLQEESKLNMIDKQKPSTQKINKVRQFLQKKQEFQIVFNKVLEQFKWTPPTMPAKSIMQKQSFIIQHNRKALFLQNYKGDFVENLFQGRGSYTWPNGKYYKGQWQKGLMNGIGEFYWPNSILYRGQYEKDKRHGKGEMIWSLQKRFRGSWAYGLRHGYGELIEIEKEQVFKEGAEDIFKNNYYVRIIGVLYDKDQLKADYFNVKRDLQYEFQALKILEKQMLCYIKDIKID